MAEEREYWLPPYWDASELFLERNTKMQTYFGTNTEYLKFANTQNSTWRERGWCAGRNDRETRILRTVHGATGPGYHDQSEITCTGIISKCVELKVTGDCEGE